MVNEKLIQDATTAYLISYNQALKETRNPGIATAAAAGIAMTFMCLNKAEYAQGNPLEGVIDSILQSVMAQAQQEADAEDNETEDETEGEEVQEDEQE